MLRLFHASSPRYHPQPIFATVLEAGLAEPLLDIDALNTYCTMYVSDRQWLTEGPHQLGCQCQSTSQLRKQVPPARGISVARTLHILASRKGANRDQSGARPTRMLRPGPDDQELRGASYRIVHYRPVPTSTPPTSLRRRRLCLHLSRPCHRTGWLLHSKHEECG
jgi:hypothetical protein